MKSSLFIYVSGIPRGTFVKSIQRCFYTAGYTVMVKSSQLVPMSPKEQLNSGHCLIETESYKSQKNLVQIQYVYFQGRRLKLEKYLSGSDLCKHNSNNNKRRVLVKKVPSTISEKTVRYILERNFGPISECYALMTSKKSITSCIKTNCRDTKTYSVMFENPVNHRLSNAAQLEIQPGSFVTIERFVIKKKLGTNSTLVNSRESTLQVLTMIDCECGDDELKNPNLDSAKLYPLEGPIGAKKRSASKPAISLQNAGRSKSINNLDTVSYSDLALNSSKIRSKSQEAKRKRTRGYSRSKFIVDLVLSCHYLKPTSSTYRLLRSEESEYLATFELRHTWIAVSNFRFNLAVKSAFSTPSSL